MKKIIIVTDAWQPQVNGVVTVFESIIPILKEQGYSVTVIYPRLFLTIPLFFYPEIRLALFPYFSLRRMLTEANADHIHIATEGPLGLIARCICKKYAWHFTTSYHTNFSQYLGLRLHILQNITFLYLKWFHNAGQATMVASVSLQQELQHQGFINPALWPLGVDTTRFIRPTPLVSVPELEHLPKPIFVYVGRIAIEKNVEAFLQLNLPGTKLIIGDGPLRKKLEQTYSTSSYFAGYKAGKDLVIWLSHCDVLVFPSKTETFGLVAIEALAMGIPVAGYNVMGPKDIITNGVDGYIGDDLETSALRCLTLDTSECRKKALQYTWEKSADSFIYHLVSRIIA